MAVRGTSVSQRFDAIKKKNPGMSDSEAMGKAIKRESTLVAKTSAKTVGKKKMSWVEKLKMGVTKQLASKRHSPAGRKHLKSKKGY